MLTRSVKERFPPNISNYIIASLLKCINVNIQQISGYNGSADYAIYCAAQYFPNWQVSHDTWIRHVREVLKYILLVGYSSRHFLVCSEKSR